MVNYELSIRGKGNLDTVSRKLVLNRSADLITNNASSFTKYRKAAKDIQRIRVQWNAKMKELEQKGYESKEALNLKKDASKLKDLEFLKNQQIPGPFTSADDVDMYINSELTIKDKQDRLYIEVRYAKATCLSMNTKSLNQFFKLRQKGKKLDYEKYADCLKSYFDTSKSMSTVTLPELKSTLGEIRNEICSNEAESENFESASMEKQSSLMQVGQHVIVFWIEQMKKVWYLGLIDRINDEGILVSHFAPNRNRSEWTFQDDSDVQLVEEEQILKHNFTVCYPQSSRIRCKLDQTLINEVENELKTI